MFFNNVYGHEDIIEDLTYSLANNSFNGVYLFVGPKGVGKYTIARELSKYLICSGVQDNTCRCPSCRLFPNSADFFEISSNGSIIKVGDVRELEYFSELLPSIGKRRVALIDDAERLNSTASNSLLKFLEDLKDHVTIILVSSHPELLVNTIRSRSSQIFFKALSSNNILEILKKNGHRANTIEYFKRAVPTLSESILNNFEIYSSCLDRVYEFMSGFPKANEEDLLLSVDSWENEGVLVHSFELMTILISDVLRIHLDDRNTIFFKNKPDIMDRLAQGWNRDLCVIALEKIRPAIADIRRGINLKFSPRAKSVVSWIHVFMKKNEK